MDKILDFQNFTDGFSVLVDVGKSEPVATVVLSFPNATQVTISGCRRAAHKQNNRVERKIKKDTTQPIRNEYMGTS